MPRHESLAKQLGALKGYIFRPETVEPVSSNWSTVPANDNRPPRDFTMEQRHEVRPSIQKIMEAVTYGETVRNEDGVIVQIGDLRFSDGTQTEEVDTLGADGKVVKKSVRVPKGAMLNDRHLQGRAYGKKANSDLSNSALCKLLGVESVAYRKNGVCRKGRSRSPQESRRLLEDAIANTPVLPAVKVFAPGLAVGTENVSAQFVGMKVGSTGKGGGAIHWQDLASKASEREMWLEIERALSERGKQTIAALDKSKNMAQVGASAGFGGAYAERKGRQLLRETNDNIAGLKRNFA